MLIKVYLDELILLKTAVELLVYLVFTLSSDKSDRNTSIDASSIEYSWLNTKSLSVRLRTKSLWVRGPLQSLKLQNSPRNGVKFLYTK